MSEKVLITGGAGFIGSHMVDDLLERGYEVTVLDNLTPQVHEEAPKDRRGWPLYLNPECRRIKGTVLCRPHVEEALAGQDYLIHLAGSVGVGQSMTDIWDYTSNNDMGTAMLLEVVGTGKYPLKRMMVAGSISTYGEGASRKPSTGEIIHSLMRSDQQIAARRWELEDEEGEELESIPTPESHPLNPQSIYAVNKYVHEKYFLTMGRAWGIPTASMRMFNVYGTRQALSNPYTGVVTKFATQLMNDQPPSVFEDGGQLRNFVHVKDVVRAYAAFLESDAAVYEAYNVGSDEVTTIWDLAWRIADLMDKDIKPKVTQLFRKGDIRHCYPDLTKAMKELNWKPSISLGYGLPEVIEWALGQSATDYTEKSLEELRVKGLLL